MRNQWSLISFTLLIQFAVGIFVVMTTLFGYNLFKSNIPFQKELINRVLWVFFTALIIALVSSFLHLGKPKSAIYALNNLGSSWLSWEILFIILFSLSAAVFTFGRIIWNITPKLEFTYLVFVSILGLMLIFSMSKIYMLETIPVWDSYYTIIQFYSSFIILGLLGLILIISNTNNTLLEGLESTKVINTSLSIILVVLFVSIIFLLIRLWNLKLGGIAELSSFNSITSKNLPLLYARIILAVLAIGLIVLQLFYLRFKHSSYLLLSLAIIMILSEITGRYLFYASYRRVGI